MTSFDILTNNVQYYTLIA